MKTCNIPFQLKKPHKHKTNKNPHDIHKIYPFIYKTEPKPEELLHRHLNRALYIGENKGFKR